MIVEAQIVNNPATDCSDLLISELSINKKLDASNNVILNYAIEIYNPTSSTINLSNYSILLNNSNSTSTSIPLSGLVTTGDVVVLSNSNSDLLLQAVSDILSVNFRYDNILSLELQKNNITIDAVGDKFQNPSNFNIPALVNDPYGYLASYDVNFDDFNNIQMVRGHFEKKGKPNFDALDLLNCWDLQMNADIGGLGAHSSACKPTASDIIIKRTGLGLYSLSNNTPPILLEIEADQASSVSGCTWDIKLQGSGGFPAGLAFLGNTTSNSFTLSLYTPTTSPQAVTSVFLKNCGIMSNLESVTISTVTPGFFNSANGCPNMSIVSGTSSALSKWTFNKVDPCTPLAVEGYSQQNRLRFNDVNKSIITNSLTVSIALFTITGHKIFCDLNAINKSISLLGRFPSGVYILEEKQLNNQSIFHKIAL
jgi:hypothetical protein